MSVKNQLIENGISDTYNNNKKKGTNRILKNTSIIIVSMAMMAASSSLIILNKHIMHDIGFPYPFALSGLGMSFSFIASLILCRVSGLIKEMAIDGSGRRLMTKKIFFLKIMPIGLVSAATLYFGNVAYLHLTVSFIQMLKAITPVITMILLFIFKLENPSYEIIYSVIIIAFGTALASYGELNFSLDGFVYMSLSCVSEALKLVMTQLIIVGMQFNSIEGLMYFSPACTIWLSLGMFLTEFNSITQNGGWFLILKYPLRFMAATVLGFCVNTLTYIIIILSSSLTLKVLGMAKNSTVVLLSVLFLNEKISLLELIGYISSLLGFIWYNITKMSLKISKSNVNDEKDILKLSK